MQFCAPPPGYLKNNTMPTSMKFSQMNDIVFFEDVSSDSTMTHFLIFRIHFLCKEFFRTIEDMDLKIAG